MLVVWCNVMSNTSVKVLAYCTLKTSAKIAPLINNDIYKLDTLLIVKDLEIGKHGHIYMCAHKAVLKC